MSDPHKAARRSRPSRTTSAPTMRSPVFDGRDVIAWHRLHDFQFVSLLLAEQLLLACPTYQKERGPPSSSPASSPPSGGLPARRHGLLARAARSSRSRTPSPASPATHPPRTLASVWLIALPRARPHRQLAQQPGAEAVLAVREELASPSSASETPPRPHTRLPARRRARPSGCRPPPTRRPCSPDPGSRRAAASGTRSAARARWPSTWRMAGRVEFGAASRTGALPPCRAHRCAAPRWLTRVARPACSRQVQCALAAQALERQPEQEQEQLLVERRGGRARPVCALPLPRHLARRGGERLADEVARARGGAADRDGAPTPDNEDGCEFSVFFSTTPADLIQDGVYTALALALAPAPFRHVACCLIARALGATSIKTSAAQGHLGRSADLAAASTAAIATKVQHAVVLHGHARAPRATSSL